MRRIATVVLAGLLALAVAAPAFAARPTIISFAEDDAADSELFTELCGFAVTSLSSGHVILHNDKNGAVTGIANYQINNWLYSATGSYHLVDAGPDMLLTKAGVEFLVITGRSLTGSSVIGRVELNLTTGEVIYHGNLVGSQPLDPNWYEPICAALA